MSTPRVAFKTRKLPCGCWSVTRTWPDYSQSTVAYFKTRTAARSAASERNAARAEKAAA